MMLVFHVAPSDYILHSQIVERLPDLADEF